MHQNKSWEEQIISPKMFYSPFGKETCTYILWGFLGTIENSLLTKLALIELA